jgi:hypothetical protein
MLQLKTLDLLPMTLDTYGLSEEEYLTIFEQKAEFACKTIRLTGRVADDYNIKLEPELWWNLHQEIGYATDDACRVKQKQQDPEALEARSYTKLDKLIRTFIEQNKDGFLGEDCVSNFLDELKE